MEFYVNGKKERYNPYNMKKDKKLGEGLEAEVYLIDNYTVKFFKKFPGKKIYITKESLEEMKQIGTKRILLPKDGLYDKKHKLRGYRMTYVEDIGQDSYFDLEKDKLKEENSILREDIKLLSDNKVLIEDLYTDNTSYNNGIYLIDPGSYRIDDKVDSNQAYGINMDLINRYLIFEVLRSYHLVKYNERKNYALSYEFSKEINKEYNRSGKNDVLEFFSDIKEDNLDKFVEKRSK